MITRIALVGSGDAGRHHARALLALEHTGALRFVGFSARDAEKESDFRIATQTPSRVPAFASFEALLDANVADAILLATPDDLHVEQTTRCLERGLHVLVEKPLAFDVAAVGRLTTLARQRDRHLAVGYHLRHHAGHVALRAQAQALIGETKSLAIRWAWPDPAVTGWRATGPGTRAWCLSALGTHGLDLVLWLTGATRVTSICAIVDPPFGAGRGLDRAAEISLRLDDGLLAHVSVSVRHRATSRVSLVGERGEIEAIGTLGARGEGEIILHVGREAPRPLVFVPENPYQAQLKAFVDQTARGFVEDAALVENVRLLATLVPARTPSPSPSPSSSS